MATYDAYFTYNSSDAAQVTDIAQRLRTEAGISCWLDTWSLVPGRSWQEEMEQALQRIAVVLVAIGSAGVGAWQTREFRTAIELFVRSDGARRVIPILLPGATEVPAFLQQFTFVDFRRGITPTEFNRLAAGISGIPPGPPESPPVPTQRRVASRRQAGTRSERALIERVDSVLLATKKWASTAQNIDGGLPSDEPGTVSCTWATAGLVFAFRQATSDRNDIWLRRACTWTLENRNHDGGVPLVTPGDASITDATAQGILAAVLSTNRDHRLALEHMCDWLTDHQQKSGGWGWRPGREAAWSASTGFAILAATYASRRSSRHAAELAASAESGVAWLLATRNGDGGWGPQAGEPSQPAITGLVTYCLAEVGRKTEAAESLGLLLSTQNSKGGWPDAVDRPTGYSVIRFGDAYGLLGLASIVMDPASGSVRKGLAALLKSHRGGCFQYQNTTMRTWPTRDGVLALAAVASSARRASQLTG